MGTKKETLDFIQKISELENKFEKIGKEVLPDLQVSAVADEVSYDAWDYTKTRIKFNAKHFKYKDIELFFQYDSVCATINEKEIWLKIIPDDFRDEFLDIFLCDYLQYEDGIWKVMSPIDPNDPEISHLIPLTDLMIKSIFEKVETHKPVGYEELQRKLKEIDKSNEKMAKRASSKFWRLYDKICRFIKGSSDDNDLGF